MNYYLFHYMFPTSVFFFCGWWNGKTKGHMVTTGRCEPIINRRTFERRTNQQLF